MSTRKELVEAVNFTTATQIKRRFAAWSLAVMGALSTSAAVSLQPSAAWGYDDPATTEKNADKQEKETSEVFNREVFSKLLSAGKLDEAAIKLDAAIALAPNDAQLLNMEYQLAAMLNRSKPEESKQRIAALVEKLMAREELDAMSGMLLMQSSMMRIQADRGLKYEDRLTLIDETIAKLSRAAPASAVQSMMQFKVRTMLSADKQAEAKTLLDTLVGEAHAAIDPEKPASISAYSSLVMLYNSSLSDAYPTEAKAIVDQAEGLFQARLEGEKATAQDYVAYVNMKMSMASSLVYSDAKQAAAILADIEKKLEAAKARFGDKDLQTLNALERSLKSTQSRIEAALEREELIGKPAPPIAAEHFVATQPVTMEELRGKVVLLDFWAVWCGPCIATFPHLIEWHEKFADKGLVILGSTNYYNYKWDEAAGKAVSAPKDEVVAAGDELAMLEKFRESHKLHHGFFVNPKGSNYAKSFAVSGIPQAVLLDKEGKIQLIRVGSGEANAKAIEAKIEELLAQ